MQRFTSFKNRMILRYLTDNNKITPNQYNVMMDQNLQASEPFKIFNLYLQILGFVLIGAGLICLTAFNWLYLSSLQKLMIAEAGLVITFTGGLFVNKQRHKEIAFALFAVVIGCFWAIFGQIYQINSSLYHYPLVWLISLLPFAIILRDKFTTLLTAVLLYTFMVLYIKAYFGFSYGHQLEIALLLLVIATAINLAFILLSRNPKSSFSTIGSYLFFCPVAITLIYCGFVFFDRLAYLTFLTLITVISIAYIFVYITTQQKLMMIVTYLIGCAFIFISLILKINIFYIGTFGLTLIWSLYAIFIAYPLYKGAIILLKLSAKKIGAQS